MRSEVNIAALSQIGSVENLATMDAESFAPYDKATCGDINLNVSDLEDMGLRERYAAILGMRKIVEGHKGTEDAELAKRIAAVRTITRFIGSTLTVADLLKEESPEPELVRAVLESYDVDRSDPSMEASHFRDAVYTRGGMTCVPPRDEELNEECDGVEPTALAELLMSLDVEDYTEYSALMNRLATIYGQELELQRAFAAVATAHEEWVNAVEDARTNVSPALLRSVGEKVEYEVIGGVRYILAEIDGELVRMRDSDQTGVEEGQFVFDGAADPSNPLELTGEEALGFLAEAGGAMAFSERYLALKSEFERNFPNHCIDGRYDQDLEGDDIDASMPYSLIQMLGPLHRQFVTASHALSIMIASTEVIA